MTTPPGCYGDQMATLKCLNASHICNSPWPWLNQVKDSHDIRKMLHMLTNRHRRYTTLKTKYSELISQQETEDKTETDHKMQMIFQVVPILILVCDVINYANSKKHVRVKLIGGRTIRQIPISSRALILSGSKKKEKRHRGKLRPPKPFQTAPVIPPSHQVNNKIKMVRNV